MKIVLFVESTPPSAPLSSVKSFTWSSWVLAGSRRTGACSSCAERTRRAWFGQVRARP